MSSEGNILVKAVTNLIVSALKLIGVLVAWILKIIAFIFQSGSQFLYKYSGK